jgi:putative glycosyltransferase (TIGR04372 family)
MIDVLFQKILVKINKEGIKTTLFKIIQYFFYGFFAILFVFLIRLLSQLFLVRLGFIDTGRIGGVYLGDWYLSEKKDGKHQGRYLDIFCFLKSTTHVNSQWMKMWRRVLPWVPGDKFWNYVILFNRQFSGFEKYKIDNTIVYPTLTKWQEHISNPSLGSLVKNNKRLNSVLKNNKPNISFSLKELNIGSRLLSELKILPNEQYICFHARDNAFLDTVLKNTDWSYHNYRDSSIEFYLSAAEEMTKRGYHSIRMGAIVKNSIDSTNPKIIDYAVSEYRTDFNDIYIGSHCRFFICSDGGMSVIPEMYRVPAVYVNWTSIYRISTWVLKGLFVFKKFYLRDEDRNMTFSEIINLNFGGHETNEMFSNLGLELIENTPEEILAVTIEMDERLNGTWKTSEEDEELQQRFWKLFGPDKLKSPNLRIGAEFLRQNKDLVK